MAHATNHPPLVWGRLTNHRPPSSYCYRTVVASTADTTADAMAPPLHPRHDDASAHAPPAPTAPRSSRWCASSCAARRWPLSGPRRRRRRRCRRGDCPPAPRRRSRRSRRRTSPRRWTPTWPVDGAQLRCLALLARPCALRAPVPSPGPGDDGAGDGSPAMALLSLAAASPATAATDAAVAPSMARRPSAWPSSPAGSSLSRQLAGADGGRELVWRRVRVLIIPKKF